MGCWRALVTSPVDLHRSVHKVAPQHINPFPGLTRHTEVRDATKGSRDDITDAWCDVLGVGAVVQVDFRPDQKSKVESNLELTSQRRCTCTC